MNDKATTLQELKKFCDEFVKERDWKQFHNPKNVSMAISGEAAELMEIFTWCTNEESYTIAQKKIDDVKDELADVITLAFMFANVCDIDIAQAIEDKMAKNREKYPIEKSKGNNTKYTEL